MTSQSESLSPDFFEALYQTNPDPWQFKTSQYEAQKYATTLAALPKPRYQSAFEIGGSIGVLTELLGDRCERVLSVDVVDRAQKEAMQRCQHLPNVRFQQMQVPQQFPKEKFDLILLSEVGYYWCWQDLRKAQQQIFDALVPSGHLLLVHWTVDAQELPLTGDQVHEAFREGVPAKFRLLTEHRYEQYRLDLFERR
ncbi:MAG: nodulation S family protein [Scytolyngbya sp. HA4215-MV1]|jgi:SAM-dependent methyltransferase|nr:nodulation S family protein [Scytolyngbya sp. HA4215-MV1]